MTIYEEIAPKPAQGTQRREARVSSLTLAIEAIATPAFVPAALDYLRANTPFVGAFAVLLSGGEPPRHVYDNVRAAKRSVVVDSYLDGAYLLDPFFNEVSKNRATRVVRLSEVAPDRFHQTAYFRTYYAATHLKDEVALFVEIDKSRLLFYSIGRRAEERPFTRREVEDLREALPIFAALNRRHFRLTGADEAQGGPSDTQEALDQVLGGLPGGELTRRERDVAEQILKGHSTKAIAQRLGIAVGTVKIHRKKIYKKLGISSQSALFSLFLDAVTRQTPHN